MTKRTRLFLLVAAGILVVGLGTGVVASIVGQNLILIGRDGPAELAYVPADSRAVAFANVREIMDSELRQKIVQFHGGDIGDDKDRLEADLGIDIERDVDEVVASLWNGGTEGDQPLVIARGTFDEDLIETTIRQKGGIVEEYKGERLLLDKESKGGVAFVEPGLAVLGAADAVRRAIDTKASGQDVRDNAELMRLVRASDDGNAWAVARFDALTAAGRLPTELANQLPAISWFAVTGYVNGGIRATLRAETRDDVAAQDLRQVLQGFMALARMQTRQRPEFTELLNSIQLGGDGKTVSLGFSVPTELIDALGALTAGRPQAQPSPLPAPDSRPTPRPRAPSL